MMRFTVVVAAFALALFCGVVVTAAATFSDCVYPPADVKTVVAPNWVVTKQNGPIGTGSNWPDKPRICWGYKIQKITNECSTLAAGSAERTACETNNGWISDFIVTPSCTNLTRANVSVYMTDFGQCFPPPIGTHPVEECFTRITYKDDSLQACGYKTAFPWSAPPANPSLGVSEFIVNTCWDVPPTGQSCPSIVTVRQGPYLNQFVIPDSAPCCGEWSNYKEEVAPPPPTDPPTDAPPSACTAGTCQVKHVGNSAAAPCNTITTGSTGRCVTLEFVDSVDTCAIMP